ncbi:MAG: thioesterase, partial [Hyphomicrobiaceae bacterium]|nr:thioesterase [Hyphomicrobiaceae bacterium]
EQMYLHLDMAARKVAPWPADVEAALRGMFAAHQGAWPERAGRKIGISRRA